jgi:hypothetical protein
VAGGNNLYLPHFNSLYLARNSPKSSFLTYGKYSNFVATGTLQNLTNQTGWLIGLFWFNVCHPEGTCRQQKHKHQQNNQERSLDKRNPPPLTVSCAPSGDEGLTVYVQTKERKQRQKQLVLRVDKKSWWVVKYSAICVESKSTSRFV